METELLTCEDAETSIPSPEKPNTPAQTDQKRCPFCAEWIQDQAIKCRYCNEFLDGSNRGSKRPRPKKWYFATGTLVMALLCLGPLALPLVWLNPRYKPATKAIITLVALALSIACTYLLGALYGQFIDQINALGI